MKNDYNRLLDAIAKSRVDNMPLNIYLKSMVEEEVAWLNTNVKPDPIQQLKNFINNMIMIPKDGTPVRLCIRGLWMKEKYKWGTNSFGKTGWMNAVTGYVQDLPEEYLTDWVI